MIDTDTNWRKWAQQFPFIVGGKACPECGEGYLHEDWVRAPAIQDHWRGVRGLVCDNDDCDHVEISEEEASR